MRGQSRDASLDEAWTAWVSGDDEAATRHCVGILEDDPAQAPAAALLLSVQADESPGTIRRGPTARAAVRLVDAFVRRGDLPRALAAALVGAGAGVDAAPALVMIAKAFGKGAPRLADVSPAPPPLPATPVMDASLRGLSGDALAARARAALGSFADAPDPIAADRPVPRLPLFGALPPRELVQLLGAFGLRDYAAGEVVVEQGEEGKDAFVVVRGRLRVERGRGDDATLLAELGPGAIFGEMALVSDAPRAARVVALEPTSLLDASRGALEAVAAHAPAVGECLSQFCRQRMVANLVRHSPILGAVAPADRRELMARFRARSFAVDEALVVEGEEAEGLYLVASGSVIVTSQDRDGEALQVAELGPGDVVGEIGLVLRRPASATVVATHPTVALELRREQFQEAIRQHPSLLSELYDLAAKREEELRTVVAQEALNVEEIVLL